MYHHHQRRLSGSPQAPLPVFSTDDLPYPSRILSQKTLDNIPAALGIDLPDVSTTTLAVPDSNNIGDKSISIPTHTHDCIYATKQSNNNNNDLMKKIHKKTLKKNHSNPTNDLTSSMSESSNGWTNDGIGINSTTTSIINSKSVCACQLLWQLERDTDSIDKFKLFFKRDHLNVDWDYVQGSSDV
jgi:hypothetical protein